MNSEQAGQEDDANHQAQNDLLYISTATKRLYALCFVVQVLIGMAYVVGQETVFRDAEDRKTVPKRVFSIWEDTEPIIVTSGAVALMITELGRLFMILADSLEQMLQRRRAERKQREQQEQRREGRGEMYTEFSMWNERRLLAEQAGQPFDEPIPGSDEFNDQEAARRDLDLAR